MANILININNYQCGVPENLQNIQKVYNSKKIYIEEKGQLLLGTWYGGFKSIAIVR